MASITHPPGALYCQVVHQLLSLPFFFLSAKKSQTFLLLDVLQIFPSRLPLIFLAAKGDSSHIHFAVVLRLQIIEDVSLEEKTVGVDITL